jgi:hypothetical protein
MFRKSDWFLVPFSFLWFGFALFWTTSVFWISANAPSGPPIVFPIFGSVFVCVGFYMAIGRFFWDAYVRSQTLYALTNKRAIILVRQPFRQIRSVELAAGTKVETEESADGSGSIIFGGRTPATYSRGWQPAGVSADFMFERVSGVRNVVGVVRGIQSKQNS